MEMLKWLLLVLVQVMQTSDCESERRKMAADGERMCQSHLLTRRRSITRGFKSIKVQCAVAVYDSLIYNSTCSDRGAKKFSNPRSCHDHRCHESINYGRLLIKAAAAAGLR